jgi:hypothetical protein
LKIIATSFSDRLPHAARVAPAVGERNPGIYGTAGRIFPPGRFRFATRIPLFLTAIVPLVVLPASLTAGEWSLIGRGVLTTNSLLYPNTGALSDVDRSRSIELSSSLGAGLEVRYTMPGDHVAVGISIDEVTATSKAKLQVTSLLTIPVTEGIRAVPLELTGYFIIPFSGERFTVYMGGGIGVYFGRRTYQVAGVESESSTVKPGFGIHVLTGISWRFFGHLDLSFDMKFRDLQFEGENTFPSATTFIDGFVYTLPAGAIHSRSQTDGILLQLGVGVTL